MKARLPRGAPVRAPLPAIVLLLLPTLLLPVGAAETPADCERQHAVIPRPFHLHVLLACETHDGQPLLFLEAYRLHECQAALLGQPPVDCGVDLS